MRSLYIITDGYPYTVGELPFIRPEIEYFMNQYKITVISCLPNELDCNNSGDEVSRLVNNGILVYKYIIKKKSVIQVVAGLFNCITPTFFKEMHSVFKSGNNILERLSLIFTHYTRSIDLYRFILDNSLIRKGTDCIYYSYWFNEATHSGIMLRDRKYRYLKVVSRAHGYDLYDFRGTASYQPFKNQMDRKIDRLLFICEQGKQYYLDNYAYNRNDNKYIINRLGVYKSDFEFKRRENELHLISCSKISDIKRVDLIVEALRLINDIKINWVHFGDGPNYDEIVRLAKEALDKKDNIDFEFKGRVANSEVVEYYKRESPDCIINVSYSEGSPVSIQEALSAGMLVVATDVGGSSEMVDGNGVLLPRDVVPDDVAKAIMQVFYKSNEEYIQMRNRSLEIWKARFDREKNIKELDSIFDEICSEHYEQS